MIAVGEETHMDLTERLIEHDLWLTDQILERATTLTDAQLDRPLALGDTWVDEVAETTLRGLLDHLVFNKENWTAALTGSSVAMGGDQSVLALRQRFAAIAPRFRELVRGIRKRDDWDTSFIDTTCDPPETFSHGSAIAHVITFSAHRRELVIGALRKLGVADLGYGDPKDWERLRLST